MPVIVIGADCPAGRPIIDALRARSGEIRAFVSDPAAVPALRASGVKTAIGDVSDGSHVGGAALNSYVAVLIGEAAVDERERSFAGSPTEVIAAWAEGLRDAGVRRAIWVDPGPVPEVLTLAVAETAHVDPTRLDPAEVGATVARFDAAASL